MKFFIEAGRKRGSLLAARYFSISSETSRCRVYKMIYQLAETYGKWINETQLSIHKIPKQWEMASLLGVHRTNVAKYLSCLEEQKILIKKQNGIFIIKLAELKRLIDCEFEKNQ